jgi:hypothetical protein
MDDVCYHLDGTVVRSWCADVGNKGDRTAARTWYRDRRRWRRMQEPTWPVAPIMRTRSRDNLILMVSVVLFLLLFLSLSLYEFVCCLMRCEAAGDDTVRPGLFALLTDFEMSTEEGRIGVHMQMPASVKSNTEHDYD